MRERLPTISSAAYARVTLVALAALSLIVLTGAAVRLTGSGLGCPDWPKCYGQAVAPLETHAIIEYGNRLISGLVGLAAVAAGALAFGRRPFRRDLAVPGVLLVVVVLRPRGSGPEVRRGSGLLVLLLGVQGIVGGVQYALKLPAEIVWVHVALACATWLTVLWATAAGGRLVPREAAERAEAVP